MMEERTNEQTNTYEWKDENYIPLCILCVLEV